MHSTTISPVCNMDLGTLLETDGFDDAARTALRLKLLTAVDDCELATARGTAARLLDAATGLTALDVQQLVTLIGLDKLRALQPGLLTSR